MPSVPFITGAADPRWGSVEIAVYDVATTKVATTVLHPHLEQGDHDAPAFLVRLDGRYLAVYSKHAAERKCITAFRSRTTRSPRVPRA